MTQIRLPQPLRAHHLEHGPREVAAFLALAAVLALGALVAVAWTAGFDLVRHRLLHVEWRWLALALSGVVAGHLGYAVAYREVVRVDRGPELRPGELGAIVSAGFGLFVPRGGFALDVEALGVRGLPEREARVRVLGLGSLEYAVLAPAALACALALLVAGRATQPGLRLSWAIGVPAGTAIALVLLGYRDRLAGAARWRRALCRALDGIRVVVRILRRPREHGLRALGGMAIYWTGDVFALGACLAAYRHGFPPVAALVLGYATGYALTRRTLPLAGAGAVEALLPFALTWVGEPLPASVLAVFAYRVLNLWLPLVPALAGLRALHRLR